MKKLLMACAIAFAFALPVQAAVDLNTATLAELESVDGIGPKKAQAIIDFRKKNGPFRSVADLDKVPGFGHKTVEMVQKSIVVGNAKAAASGKAAELKEVKDDKAAKAIKDVSGKK